MAWFYLFIAGVFEVLWALSTKYTSDENNKIFWWTLVVLGYFLSYAFLALAIKKLPLGTSYAVWTGIGTIGTTLVGIYLFKETLSLPQAVCVALIIGGIIGLKLLSKY